MGEPSGSLSFFVDEAATPGHEPVADIHVLPAAAFLGIQPALRPFPVLAYGKLRLLESCLREGALDFVASPLEPRELVSRLHARLALLPSARPLVSEGLPPALLRSLLPREERLLRILMLAEGRILSRESLSMSLWGQLLPDSRRLDMLVSKLRGKLLGCVEWRGGLPQALRREGYALRGQPVDNL